MLQAPAELPSEGVRMNSLCTKMSPVSAREMPGIVIVFLERSKVCVK
jgi:hypothetical protein